MKFYAIVLAVYKKNYEEFTEILRLFVNFG